MDKQTVYKRTMKYYLAVKKNGYQVIQDMDENQIWMKINCMFLSEGSQSERAIYSMTFVTFWKGRTI